MKHRSPSIAPQDTTLTLKVIKHATSVPMFKLNNDYTVGHWVGIEPSNNDRAAVLNVTIAILNNEHHCTRPLSQFIALTLET